MARGDKPYRVYRGGRAKGKVPTLPRPERNGRRAGGRVERPDRLAPAPRRRRIGWGRRIALVLGLLVLLLVAWAVAAWLAVSKGVGEANERLAPEAAAVLDDSGGLALNEPTTVLLFGTDHSRTIQDRQTARRSDSILLLRTDPARNRISYLSIPRDLRVEIPGHGSDRINTAFQLGGPALAIRTVRNFTGIPIEHVALVDFSDFEQLIDALGGITVDVPRPIVSNRFDCPYATEERCQAWQGWRFEAGEQELNGRRALVYSRIRENRLDPSETDITRGERQQQVLRAITDELTSPETLVRLPVAGDELLAPLATDLSTWELAQLGWRKFRAGTTLHCRLGGDPSDVGGASVLIPVEENRNVVSMFLGASAPQPPPPGTGPFGPGCVVR